MRFPEFSGEWEKTSIGNCCYELEYGMNAPSKNFDGINKYIRITDIDEQTAEYKQDFLVSPDAPLEDKYIVKDGDILFARTGASTGKTYIYNPQDGKIYYAGFLIRANVKNENNPKFVFYQTKTYRYKKWISIMSMRSGQPGINSQEYASYKFLIPIKAEQDKISCLINLLDLRIQTQRKIIDKYESLIKGIIDSAILNKHQNVIIQKVCKVSEQTKVEPDINKILTVRLHCNGVYKSNAENLQLGATQYYHRTAGQLIYGKQNFHNGAISIIPDNLDGGITSKDIPSFDIDYTQCNPIYLLSQLQSPKYYKKAEALTTGTGSKRLKEETFLKMGIVLPPLSEQNNIAKIISRVTKNIDYNKKLLQLFCQQKQYLFHQMFI